MPCTGSSRRITFVSFTVHPPGSGKPGWERPRLYLKRILTTDEEYARQLDKLPQGESFRWLMAAYERVWYGKFALNDQQFSRLFQYFQDFHTSIDHSRRA